MTRTRLIYIVSGLLLVALIATLGAGGGSTALDWRAALAGEGVDYTILVHFRLPRIALAALSGAALGIAGSVLQVMLRNPLASPDIIGFGAGAAAGGVAAIVLSGSLALVAPGALLGGGLAAVAVLGLSWKSGLSPLALVLTGVALSLMLATVADILLSLSPGLQAAEAARFLTGGFSGADWAGVLGVAAVLAAGWACMGWLSFSVDRLDTGDEIARAHGLRPDRVRLAAAALSAVIVSVSVSVTGPLPFVSFLAGPLARGISGKAGTCLGLSALFGALICLGADSLSRFPVAGTHLPAGLFTAMIGGPAMLVLLVRQGGRG